MSQPDDRSQISAKEKSMKTRLQKLWQWLRRDIFFYALVLFLAFLATLLAWPYFSSILLALAGIVILKPLYDWFLKQRWLRSSTKWAAIATIITALILIVAPVILFFSAALSQAQDLVSSLVGVDGGNSIQELLGSIEQGIQRIPGGGTVQIDESQTTSDIQDLLSTVAGWLGDAAMALGAALPQMFVGFVIAIAIVMTFLPRYERDSNQKVLSEIIPFPEQITELYIDKTKTMMTGMFRGSFVIAFVQGLVMGLVLWIAGVPSVIFFTLLSMIAALLPVVGLSIVAWPIGIILLLSGQTWQGLWVIGAYLLVVSNIDFVLRPRLVPEGAYLNPALLLIGVFGGINLFGPVGLLYGPVIMVLLVTSISVYTKYILRSDLQPYLDADGNLDLEKLGLEPADNDADATKKSDGWLEKTANKAVGYLLQRSDSPDDSDAQGEAPITAS